MKTLTVNARGIASAAADIITVSLTVRAKNKSYGKATEKQADDTEAVKNALVLSGVEKESVKTADFSVNAEYEGVNDERGNYKQVFSGYVCTHTLETEFGFDKAMLGRVIENVSRCGAEPVMYIAFGVKDSEALADAALNDAVEKAKKRAFLLAEAAGVALGEITEIRHNVAGSPLRSETAFDCANETMGRASFKAVDIAPKDVEAHDSVSIVWEIKE